MQKKSFSTVSGVIDQQKKSLISSVLQDMKKYIDYEKPPTPSYFQKNTVPQIVKR